MKKKYFCALLALILCMAFASPGLANAPITIKVNGTTLQPDVPPQIINGRTMVPLSAIAGSLDCDVQWLPDLQQVNITSKTTTPNTTIAITGPDDFRQVIQEALDKMDNKTIQFVRKYITTIKYDEGITIPSSKAAMINMSTHTCYFAKSYFDKEKSSLSHSDLVFIYSALLVHESSHLYYYYSGLENAYSGDDLEALCDLAALRAIEKAGIPRISNVYKAVKNNIDKELQY